MCLPACLLVTRHRSAALLWLSKSEQQQPTPQLENGKPTDAKSTSTNKNYECCLVALSVECWFCLNVHVGPGRAAAVSKHLPYCYLCENPGFETGFRSSGQIVIDRSLDFWTNFLIRPFTICGPFFLLKNFKHNVSISDKLNILFWASRYYCA